MKTKQEYPNIIKLITLVMFLFIPFLLRFINGKYEIYPAILLPSGATKINTKDTLLKFNKYELFGIDNLLNNRKELDPRKFVHPIPLYYWPGISSYGFGLDSLNSKKIDIRRLNIHFENQLHFSQSEIGQTKNWLRQKLREQSCLDSIFYVTFSHVFFDQSTSKIDSSIIINEIVFQLY